MSNQILTQLWKPGRNGDIHFCGSWKRLEQEEPRTYKLVKDLKPREQAQDDHYSYTIYDTKFGLSVGRRLLTGMENLPQLEDKPPARPPMTTSSEHNDFQTLTETLTKGFTMLAASIDELRYAINSSIFTDLCSTPEERERLLNRVRKQEQTK